MQVTEFVDVNYYDDSNYDYVLTQEWECPADVPRSLWEISPDGRCVIREGVLERKNEIPAKKRWAARLKLKFKLEDRYARLLAYMVRFIAGDLRGFEKLKFYWEDWIKKEGFEAVWTRTRKMFWALYRERPRTPGRFIQDPVTKEPVPAPVAAVKEKETVVWIPMPLKVKEEKDERPWSWVYMRSVNRLRKTRSLLELKLLKKIYYLAFQRLRKSLSFQEEKLLWQIVKNYDKKLPLPKNRKVKEAINKFLHLAFKGETEELKQRTIKYCRAWKEKRRNRPPVYFYRALYLAFWLRSLMRN